MPDPKGTTLAKLARSLAPHKVTSITQLGAGQPGSPDAEVVDHPDGVRLAIAFEDDATVDDRKAAKDAVMAATILP